MDILAIESAIIDRLAPLRTADIWVRALPDQAKDLGIPTIKGIVTVYWDKTKFDNPESTGAIVQWANLQFVIEFRLRSLREPSGAYPAIRYICNRLIGFEPPRSKKIFFADHEFMGEKEKFWVHQLRLVVPTQIFEVADDSDLVLLKQITLDDGYGGVIVNEGSLLLP